MRKVVYTMVIAGMLSLLGSVQSAMGQPTKYAQAGMTFLKIDVSARNAAMAGTQAGITGDIGSMFANPAGLAQVRGVGVMASVNNWLADINHYGAGAAYGSPSLGTFGVSVVTMDYGEIRRTVPALVTDPISDRNQGYIDQGTFGVSEMAVGVAYARQITGQFYVGGHVRYARQDLGNVVIFNERTGENTNAENVASNIVLDIGTLYYPGFRDLRFGVSLRNFSNQSDYYDQRFELPLTFDFGAAMDLLSVTNPDYENNTSSLTLALDWLHPRDYSERLNAGLEYGFMDTVFLRSGYRFNSDVEGFTAGLGVDTELGDLGLQADYAYGATNNFFGAIHRVTLGLSL